MKKVFVAAASGLALAFAAAPVAAQDDTSAAEMDALSGMFGDMFGTAEPLNAEQEARLPEAQAVVEQIFPAGTYAKMMGESVGPMMDGVLGASSGIPRQELGKLTGLYGVDLAAIEDAAAAEALRILDPDFDARLSRITEISQQVVIDAMAEVEPGYRAGLARAYAVRFTRSELDDLSAYFATPVGAKYAAESILIYTDPQVMAAMNEFLPAMVEMMPRMTSAIGEAAGEFSEGRTFSDLTEAEQARLAELTDMTAESLAAADPKAPDAQETEYEEGEVETIDTSDM